MLHPSMQFNCVCCVSAGLCRFSEHVPFFSGICTKYNPRHAKARRHFSPKVSNQGCVNVHRSFVFYRRKKDTFNSITRYTTTTRKRHKLWCVHTIVISVIGGPVHRNSSLLPILAKCTVLNFLWRPSCPTQ